MAATRKGGRHHWFAQPLNLIVPSGRPAAEGPSGPWIAKTIMKFAEPRSPMCANFMPN